MRMEIMTDENGNRYPVYYEDEPVNTDVGTDTSTSVDVEPEITTIKIYVHVENERVQGWASSPMTDSDFEVEIEKDHKFLSSYPMNWYFIDGELVEGTDLILSNARQVKLNELNTECQSRILAGFEHDGNFFDFTEKDQANFNQQLSLLLLDPTDTSLITWKTENNGIQQFTREQFIETCKAGEVHKRMYIGRYWQLKAYVETLTTVEDIQAVTFETDISTNTDTSNEVVS